MADYAYDPLGRLAQVQEIKRAGQTLTSPVVTAYSYDAVGGLTGQVTTQGGMTLGSTANSYDPQTHLLQGVVNSGGVLSTFTYTRRPDGQITQVDEHVKQTDITVVRATPAHWGTPPSGTTRNLKYTRLPEGGTVGLHLRRQRRPEDGDAGRHHIEVDLRRAGPSDADDRPGGERAPARR